MACTRRVWRKDPGTGTRRQDRFYSLDFDDPLTGRRVLRLARPLTTHKRVADEILYRELADAAEPRAGRSLTFKEIIKHYRGHLRAHSPSTLKAKGYWLDWWEERYGRLGVSAFGMGQVNAAIEELMKRELRGPKRLVAAGTIGGYLGVLRAAFGRALKDGLIEGHPVAHMEITHQSPERRARFTDEEIPLWKARLMPWAAHLVDVLLATGLRIGDALALQWGAVARPETIDFWQGKTRRQTLLPLSPAAVLAFDAIPRTGTFVFPNFEGKIRTYRLTLRSLRLGMDRAGILGRTPHDLRRTFAQRLKEEGADDRVISFLLGHATPHALGKYSWVELEMARRALGYGAEIGKQDGSTTSQQAVTN